MKLRPLPTIALLCTLAVICFLALRHAPVAPGPAPSRPGPAAQTAQTEHPAPDLPPQTPAAAPAPAEAETPAPAAAPAVISSNLWRLTPREIDTAGAQPTPPGTPLIVADLDTTAAAETLPNLKEGDTIQIPLPSGGPATGHINLVQTDHGVLRIGGELAGWENGSFSFALINGRLMATILLPAAGLAYEIEPFGPVGDARMQALPLSSVICHPLPRPPDDPGAPAGAPAPMAAAASPLAAAPLLSSRPSAPVVLYLCFDGATVRDSHWNSGNTINAAPSTLTAAQIEQVWKRVAEDYIPFNVDVTTNPNRYNNTPAGKRMRCIITPTYGWFSNMAGGVAYLNSFSKAGSMYSGDIPCWVFNTTPDSIAEAASHELGHTLGLEHDGRVVPDEEYFHGHGSSPMSWGPIMGASYYIDIVQWSKGEYNNASNHEDDIAIILKPANNIARATPATGGTRQTAVALKNTNGAFSGGGVIISQDSADFHSLTVNTAQYLSIKATPAMLVDNPSTRQRIANLDIQMTLLDGAGNTLDTDNPSTATDAAIERNLPSGVYYIKIEGSGYGDPRANGYSKYGSIGQYAITGTTTAPVSAPQIINHPQTRNATSADYSFTLSVTATGAGTLRYQWQKDGADLSTSERIANVTAAALTVYNPRTDDTGAYTVTVRNAGGAVTSNAATVTVTAPPPPVITTHPASKTVSASNYNFSLSVTATGIGSLHYQWYKDGAPLASSSRISGVTSDYLYIYDPGASDAGIYTVKVSNAGGDTESQPATITIKLPAAPVIGRHPSDVTAYLGENSYLYISAYASGDGHLACQWQKNGVDIVESSHYSGVHGSSLFIYDYTEDDAGEYRIVVSNKGGSVTSNAATVTIKMPGLPVINTHPENRSVQAGEYSANLSVSASGHGLKYQWQKNGADLAPSSRISGVTSSYLYIQNPSLDDAGAYRVRITNPAGTVTSDTGTLTVTLPPLPVFNSQTGAMTVYESEAFSLSCSVSSVNNTTYQWYKDNIPIINATSTRHDVSASTFAHAGTYKLAATNPSGVSYSAGIKVTILAATRPEIVIHPESRNIYAGQSITFTAAATGRPAPAYQWYENGAAIPYATNSQYTKTNAQSTDAGSYAVVATNKAGSATSEPAELVIIAPDSGAAAGIFPAEKTVGCARLTYRVWVRSNAKWTIVNDTPWISTSRLTGAFEDVIEITVAPNPIPLQRQAVITIAGHRHTLTQHPAGTPVRELWGAGANAAGQLGIYKPATPYYPKQIPIEATYVSTGIYHTLFIKPDGTLWGAGNNSNSQLGAGPGGFLPRQVAAGVKTAAVGNTSTLFIKTDNTLWGLGSGSSGQLGLGNSHTVTTPTLIATDVQAVAAGYNHSLFLKTDGTLWAMGNNYDGQLGDNSTTNRNTPVQIASNVKAVAAGGNHTLFIKDDNTLWSAGYNYYGQLGDGTTTSRSTPVKVADNTKTVIAAGNVSYFIKTDDTLWAMGGNGYGILGDGRSSSWAQPSPIQITTNVRTVATGGNHTLFIKQDGALWAAGGNYYGELCDGTTLTRATPVWIAANVQNVHAGGSRTYYIDDAGALMGMGENNYGALGLGISLSPETTTPVHIASDIQSVTAGSEHSLCVTAGSDLLGFGGNTNGQLGNGTTRSYSEPAKIASNVTQAAAGSYHSLFVKTDGTLWAMGNNGAGQLGDPSQAETRHTPVQIAANVKYAAAGSGHSIYMDNGGQLWGMGNNYYKQLGITLADTNSYLPRQLATDAAAVAAGSSHTLLVKTDKTLHAAGYSDYGQTAQPSANSITFTQIAANTATVAAGSNHSLWITTDGSLWAVGYNNYGQLGNGLAGYSNHTPVNTAANARAIAAGAATSLYIDTNDTLHTAGNNSSGQLGDGTTTTRATYAPVAANIDTAAAGASHTLFIAKGDIRLNPPPPPAITNFAPSEIIAQSRVVITGSHFTNAAGVYFGNTPAQTYTVDSDTQITAYAPNIPPEDGAHIHLGTFDGAATSASTYSASYAPLLGDTIPAQLVVIGGTLAIHAPVLGAPAPTVNWQYSTDNGATWRDLPADLHHGGVTTPTLTITNAATTLDGNRYRFTAANAHGSITAPPFTLTIARPPALATQTGNITVNAGATATLNATFTAIPAPALQWQISTDLGATWTNLADTAPCAGVTTTTLTITPAARTLDGAYCRCLATNPHGTAASTPSRITVLLAPAPQPGITTQSVVNGRDTTLIANTTGNPAPSIQWQVSTDGGSTWNNITDNTQYTGAATPMLDITAVTTAMNNYKYRYRAANTLGSAYGDPLTLHVLETLFTQPEGLAHYGGQLYITDSKLHTVQKTNTHDNITRLFAGQTGIPGATLTGANAQFNKPAGIAIDSNGAIYVADTGNNSLRILDQDGSHAADTRFSATNPAMAPGAIVAPEYSGKVYFTMPENHTVYMRYYSGTTPYVNSIAGSAGTPGFTDGQFGQPGQTLLRKPSGITYRDGYIYIADTGNHAIRVIISGSHLATLAGNGTPGSADGAGATARFNSPRGMAAGTYWYNDSTIYVADTGNSTIRSIDKDGIVRTIAGNPGLHGHKDGVGKDAWFDHPADIAYDYYGNTLYIADTGNATIRKLNLATNEVTTLPLVSATNFAPVFTQHPQNATITQGSASNHRLAVSVTGLGYITMRWQKDGADITNSGKYYIGWNELTIYNPTVADSGQYRAVAISEYGATPSNPATITITTTGTNGTGGNTGGNGGSGSGGGGAPTIWHLALAAIMAAIRLQTRKSKNPGK